MPNPRSTGQHPDVEITPGFSPIKHLLDAFSLIAEQIPHAPSTTPEDVGLNLSRL